LFGVVAWGAAGCSAKKHVSASDPSDASTESDRPESDKPDASQDPSHSQEDDKVDDKDQVDSGTQTDAGAHDAGLSEHDAGNPCAVPDDPDDNFSDTNCDGIDGDIGKALFVATTGSDAADGSFGKPVATLARGIALATSKGKDVYACAGVYKESIALESRGVRVYGGYDCSQGWHRDSNASVRLIAPAGTALSIRGASLPVVFDRVDIEAADAAQPGDSSIAVFVANSTRVTLRRGTYRAGDGATANPPADMPAAQPSTVVALQGNYAAKTQRCGVAEDGRLSCSALNLAGYTFAQSTPDTRGLQQTSTLTLYCPAGDYSYGGGGGGTSPSDCYASSDGTQGYPVATSGTRDGLVGSDGTSGTAASMGHGSLGANGYSPSNLGQPGTPGSVGQGGTGGRGGGIFLIGPSCDVCSMFEPIPIAGGGQGGPGGCGGPGGAPGNAGGASIAVAVYHSQVTLEHVTLQTSKGGGGSSGGNGGVGAPGVQGASAGMVSLCGTLGTDPRDSRVQQAGGNGGDGGNGGRGGPGGGGPSVPLFVSGDAPMVSAVTFIRDVGGSGGANDNGLRAQNGESVDQKRLP
jgi:hypothetical protein